MVLLFELTTWQVLLCLTELPTLNINNRSEKEENEYAQ